MALSEIVSTTVPGQTTQTAPTVVRLEAAGVVPGQGVSTYPFTLHLTPGSHTFIASFIPAENDQQNTSAASAPVTINVTSHLTLSPRAPSFTVAFNGPLPAPQAVTVAGAKGKISASVSADAVKWLSVGVNGNELKFSVLSAAAQFVPAAYSGTVTVTDSGDGVTDSFPITLEVTGRLIAPAPVAIAATSSAVNAFVQLTAQDNGAIPFILQSDQPWLTAIVDSASTPANVAITVDPTGLQRGRTYTGSLSVIAKYASNQVKIPVSFSIVEPTEIVSNVSTTVTFDGQTLRLPAVLAWFPDRRTRCLLLSTSPV